MSEKKKVMMINVTHAEESRVAIVVDGILEAFEIETFDHKAQKGNLYKGRVESVHPGLQAAFVDIGGQRAGFLPLDEVNFKVTPPLKDGARGRIENHIRKGQELLVQVVRDAFSTKPPTLSTYFSLPGRFLVLTPYGDGAGVSRKLDDEQRDRLRKVLDGLAVPDNFGVIVRTAGAASTKTELGRDLKYLMRLWQTIEDAAHTVRAPKLIYQERSLVIRAIRDLFTTDIDEILVDDEATCREICEFFDVMLPQKKKVVRLHQGDRPIFNKYNLEEQIENIFRRRVPLPSGGAVIFDQTEALTAIDVNSGRMVQEGHIEDTALKTNIEAAQEIARQMRLRDLGGLVVIDFIDMRASKNIRQVEKVMKDALKKDKARYDITRISSLGLMEISRERLSAGKTSQRYTDCPFCEGSGSFKTVEAAAMQALRRLQTAIVRGNLDIVEITVPPEVAEYLLNQKRGELGGWEERYHTQILVKGDPAYIRDRCDVRTVVGERPADATPVVATPTHTAILAAVEADAEESEDEDDAGGEAAAEGEGGRKRRRRRRGGRKHRKTRDATENGGAQTATANGGAQTATAPDVEEIAPAPVHEETPEEAPENGGADVREAEGAGNGDGARKRRRRRRGGRKHRKNRERFVGDGAGGPAASSGDLASAGVEVTAAAFADASIAPAALEAQAAPAAAHPFAAEIRSALGRGEGQHGPRAEWWRRLVGLTEV